VERSVRINDVINDVIHVLAGPLKRRLAGVINLIYTVHLTGCVHTTGHKVPENTDCTLADEFSHIKRWAEILMVLLLILIKLKNWFYIAHTLLGISITSRSLLQVLSRSLL